jgi:hypothetical protein
MIDSVVMDRNQNAITCKAKGKRGRMLAASLFLLFWNLPVTLGQVDYKVHPAPDFGAEGVCLNQAMPRRTTYLIIAAKSYSSLCPVKGLPLPIAQVTAFHWLVTSIMLSSAFRSISLL